MDLAANPQSNHQSVSRDPIAEMLRDDAWRMRVEGRFWPKVARLLDWSACWDWQAAATPQGYGKFKLKSYEDVRAHRVSYALFYGAAPGGLLVCHKCDRPPCVNPTHLFLGTDADNSADKVAKGRALTGDQAGERNGAAKLNAAQVEHVRRFILAGWTNKAIAAQFGVTHQAISRIRRGHSWGEAAMQPKYASLKRFPPPLPLTPGGAR